MAAEFEAAGVALYVISYDSVEALAEFTSAHGAYFVMLSDPESAVIREFDILNTLIDADDHPWHGIPFPGSYIVGADGVITAKFFENTLQMRAGAHQLLRAALGETVSLPPLDSPPGEVVFDVHFDGDVFHATTVHDLLVRFAVPSGMHLYSEPVPEGMVATTVEVDAAPSLVVHDQVLPPTRAHVLAGTGETLQVFDGDVVVRVPLAQLGQSLTEQADGSYTQVISGTVWWQACDDEMCHLPRAERFEIEVPATPQLRPEDDAANPDGMDILTHISALTARHTDKSIFEVMQAMNTPEAD